MKFILEITMKNTEGVLERILGKLRQRNLNIQTINASCTADWSNIEAKITVESKMTAEPIMKQLAKLYDVQKVNVFSLNVKDEISQTYYTNPTLDTPISKSLGEQNAVCLSI
jgi:acetolactate synthase small subunit